jgi:PhnB protein
MPLLKASLKTASPGRQAGRDVSGNHFACLRLCVKSHAARQNAKTQKRKGAEKSFFFMSGEAASVRNEKTALEPLLSVRKGASAIEFYKTAFGAKECFRVEDDKGEVVARLSVNGAAFWLADESPEHFNFSPESIGGSSARMILIVENPDGMFARALSAGASIVQPVKDQSYGWRVGRVVDPFGHHWEIGKPLADCGTSRSKGK